MNPEIRDVFICHASEDKDEIVRPLSEAFNQADISYWYDEAEIGWGDSITEKVNSGIGMSRYVIVVFSSSFLSKNWPQRELNAVMNIEAASGAVKVLPLIAGSEGEKRTILAKYPLLNDKRYLPWDGDLREIVSALLQRMGREVDHSDSRKPNRPTPSPGIKIPLPKIRKKITQLDKDRYLKESFSAIQGYFQNALEEASTQYSENPNGVRSQMSNFVKHQSLVTLIKYTS